MTWIRTPTTPRVGDSAAGIKWFPEEGSTHLRLREAVETNDIACLYEGFNSRSAKRPRGH